MIHFISQAPAASFNALILISCVQRTSQAKVQRAAWRENLRQQNDAADLQKTHKIFAVSFTDSRTNKLYKLEIVCRWLYNHNQIF